MFSSHSFSFSLRGVRRLCQSLAVVKYDNRLTSIDINGKVFEFNNVFLRDACKATSSVDPHSNQKLFNTSQISLNLQILEPPVVIDHEGEPAVQIKWSQQDNIHESVYPLSFLLHYSTHEKLISDKFFGHKRVFWDNSIFDGQEPIDFSLFMNDKSVFNSAVKQLNKYGLLFVNNIPDPSALETMTEQNSGEWPISKLAERFGYIKKTFYGTLFDVKTVEEAKNIAYTSVFLPLHMDLLYYESPPGLQLLHAIKNSTEGGENIFADSFMVAEKIRQLDPEAYKALTEVPITYYYDNEPEYYYYRRPLIVEDEIVDPITNQPYIKELNYSPPFQGPFEVTKSENFDDFIRGFSMFESMITDPANQFQIKLPEGTCVIFDNRRVLHSRNEFWGERWLMGCYVDGDSFRSRLRVAERES